MYYIESQKSRKKIRSVKVKIKTHVIEKNIIFFLPLLRGVIVLIDDKKITL